MAFYAHMGSIYAGSGSMPTATFSSALDDIYADVSRSVASGTNRGWTVHDDMRNMTGVMVWDSFVNVGGLRDAATNTIGFTTNSVGFNNPQAAGNSTQFFRDFHDGTGSFVNQVSTNGTTWYTVARVVSAVSGGLTTPYAGATVSTGYVYARTTASFSGANYGYLVLKCSSSNGMDDFYVKIQRIGSFGDAFRVTAYAAWDTGTHAGTEPGATEALRCYNSSDSTRSAATPVNYMLWLLPDTFALYTQPDQSLSANTAGDIIYISNLDPLRGAAADKSALLQTSSNQSLSGFTWRSRQATLTTTFQATGCATIRRTLAGNSWQPYTQPYTNNIDLRPRGADHLDLPTTTNLDASSKFQMVAVDAYVAVQSVLFTESTQKRGTCRYLKFPVSNPSGLFLSTFGPADDGNTYIMVRAAFNPGMNGSNPPTGELASSAATAACSGIGRIAIPWTASGATVVGEITFQGSSTALQYLNRFMLLPTNI